MSTTDKGGMGRATLFKTREGSSSLKGTIPNDIVSAMKLKDRDELDWEIAYEDGEFIAKVRKVKKAKTE